MTPSQFGPVTIYIILTDSGRLLQLLMPHLLQLFDAPVPAPAVDARTCSSWLMPPYCSSCCSHQERTCRRPTFVMPSPDVETLQQCSSCLKPNAPAVDCPTWLSRLPVRKFARGCMIGNLGYLYLSSSELKGDRIESSVTLRSALSFLYFFTPGEQ